jgi:hypothetical protein
LLGTRRSRERRADRLTVALAVGAAATAGTVFAGQFLRMVGRRAGGGDAQGTVLESAEHALGTATQATQDTVTVVREGYSAAPRREIVLFNILSGFSGGFGLMRLSTWGMRGGWWPFGSVSVRGRHVHHFVPGILLAFAAGGAGLVTKSDRLEEILAFPFGAGIGLTFDEAALLLELDDVYWTPEGVLSVQVSFGVAGLLGATILGMRMLRRGEIASEQAGLIPDEAGEYVSPGSV